MSILAPIWGYLAAAVAGLFGLAGLYLKGRSDAKAKARADAMQADINHREARNAVDRTVALNPDPIGELRRSWQRPEPVRPVAPDPDRRG